MRKAAARPRRVSLGLSRFRGKERILGWGSRSGVAAGLLPRAPAPQARVAPVCEVEVVPAQPGRGQRVAASAGRLGEQRTGPRGGEDTPGVGRGGVFLQRKQVLRGGSRGCLMQNARKRRAVSEGGGERCLVFHPKRLYSPKGKGLENQPVRVGGAGGMLSPTPIHWAPWTRGHSDSCAVPGAGRDSPALRLRRAGQPAGPPAGPAAGGRAAGTGRPARPPTSRPARGPPTTPRGRRPRGPWRLRTCCGGPGRVGCGDRRRGRSWGRCRSGSDYSPGVGVGRRGRPPLKGTSWPSRCWRWDPGLPIGGRGGDAGAGGVGGGDARRYPAVREGQTPGAQHPAGTVSWSPKRAGAE